MRLEGLTSVFFLRESEPPTAPRGDGACSWRFDAMQSYPRTRHRFAPLSRVLVVVIGVVVLGGLVALVSRDSFAHNNGYNCLAKYWFGNVDSPPDNHLALLRAYPGVLCSNVAPGTFSQQTGNVNADNWWATPSNAS